MVYVRSGVLRAYVGRQCVRISPTLSVDRQSRAMCGGRGLVRALGRLVAKVWRLAVWFGGLRTLWRSTRVCRAPMCTYFANVVRGSPKSRGNCGGRGLVGRWAVVAKVWRLALRFGGLRSLWRFTRVCRAPMCTYFANVVRGSPKSRAPLRPRPGSGQRTRRDHELGRGGDVELDLEKEGVCDLA